MPSQKNSPEAPASNQARNGKTRFTVISARMIRMEQAEDGHFEDNATLSAFNRDLGPVKFKTSVKGKSMTVSTDAVAVTCSDCDAPFSSKTLFATFKMEGRESSWRFGQKDPKNLKGTCRTLDCTQGACKVKPESWIPFTAKKTGPVELCDGLVSRSGWAVYDDSSNILLKQGIAKGQAWVAKRPEGKRFDLYLLAYGLDYQAALKDAAGVFGRQPLPPRYALGYWYCRYWAYTDKEIEGIVKQFDTMQVPLDVMVIDMDWHLPGWTGYTWCPAFFPNPEQLLADLKERGLKVSLNLHPAQGVANYEKQFKDVCADMGLDPKKTDRVPFDCTDPKFMDSYFKRLHNPMEDAGVDVWWMDWQQGTETKLPGLDPLPWLNNLHCMDPERRSKEKRPIFFSRFGGLGAGRYPIGFSGDTVSVWESLAYQPYFTSTAANVVYGYWSHDIGGHMPGITEPELYARWIQFGVFSPVLRTHSTKRAEAERRVWEFPSPYSGVMIEALRRRYELIPYIYGENRKGMDSGVSLVRPMYYAWPKEEAAYKAVKSQYMFGDQMLVAPVVSKSKDGNFSNVQVWLPEGEWIDTATGELLKGGVSLTRKYTLEEIPVFVRKGALVPLQRGATRVMPGSYKELALEVYPGASFSTELYEDDGVSQRYLEGEAVRVPLSVKSSAGKTVVTVGKAQGSFNGFLATRPLEVRVMRSAPPKSLLVDGRKIEWSRKPAAGFWSYVGDKAMVVVNVPKLDLEKGLTLEMTTDPKADALADGLRGLMTRLDKAGTITNMATQPAPVHPDERLASLLAQTGNRVSRAPETFVKELQFLRKELPKLSGKLKEYQRGLKKRKLPEQVKIVGQAVALLKAMGL